VDDFSQQGRCGFAPSSWGNGATSPGRSHAKDGGWNPLETRFPWCTDSSVSHSPGEARKAVGEARQRRRSLARREPQEGVFSLSHGPFSGPNLHPFPRPSAESQRVTIVGGSLPARPWAEPFIIHHCLGQPAYCPDEETKAPSRDIARADSRQVGQSRVQSLKGGFHPKASSVRKLCTGRR
jgi:hypothetical protein